MSFVGSVEGYFTGSFLLVLVLSLSLYFVKSSLSSLGLWGVVGGLLLFGGIYLCMDTSSGFICRAIFSPIYVSLRGDVSVGLIFSYLDIIYFTT